MHTSGKAGRRLLALCALFIFATEVRASTFVLPTDDDLIVGARAIIRAKVLSMSCQSDESTGRIFTYVRLRVREVLKGQISEREIVIKEEGGQVGTRGSIVFGTPQFTAGEHVVLYLDTWRDGSLRVYQMFLGKFSIIPDPRTGESLVVRDAGDKNSAVLQNETRAGVSTSRDTLVGYREMVRRRLRINRERSQKFQETYYANIPLLAEPAEYRHVSGHELDVQFTLFTSPPPRWFEPDSGLPVVFLVNPDGAPNPQIADDVTAAMNAWSNVPGTSLRVVNGGPTESCYPNDSNGIVFNNCDGEFSPSSGCSSIIALGGLSWDSSQTRIINGTTFVRAIVGHISFNPYSACSFSDHCSVQEVATHEMGHALGLGHSHNPDATMFGIAHFDGRCASIRQDDIDAITFVYPAAGGGNGPLTVVTGSPVGIGTEGSAFSRQLTASGGVAPYSWALASGLLPDGLTLSSSGIISGTPTTIGTSDFTVKVTDALGGFAQKSLSITVVAPPSGYDSQFISQDVPTKLNPGQPFFATIRWVNTSTKPWSGSSGFAIVSQNPADNVSWGGNMVPWIQPPVAPGEQMNLLFQANAPARAGLYDFQWQLYEQGVGFFGQMSTNVSIQVGDPVAPPDPLSIGGGSSLSAVQGAFFTYTIPATGGTPPYTWQVATGTLPAGIGLSSNTGALTGTPTVVGTSSVTVQMIDAKSQTTQKALTITVNVPPLDIATSSLPTATRGTSFSQQLNATGGKPSYTWTVTAGALPGGLSLASATGIISGTPNVVGNFGFTATATDAQSHTASKPLAIVVVAPPLVATSVPSLDGLKGSLFSYQLAATGGTPPYTWSITAGSLPSGLSLSSTGGLISGVPTVAGFFSCVVTVRDSALVTATTSVQIKLLDPETIPAITKAKYKNRKKLIVTGQRVNAAAVLLVDNNQMSATASEGSFVLKPIALAPGRHELKIVNPGGVFSQGFILTVN